MIKICDVSEQIRGVSYKPTDIHAELNENSVILLRANNISDGKINFDEVVYVDKSKVSKKQYLKKGDILICASSGSKQLVGKAASVNFDTECTFGAFCKVVRPFEGFCDYLGVYFQSDIYRRKISELSLGANINNIKNEHIDLLEIPLCDETATVKFVQSISKIQEIIDKRKQQLQQLDDIVKARFVEMFGDPVCNSKELPELTLPELGEFGRGVSKHRPRNDPKLLGGKHPLIQTGEVANSKLYITSYENTYSELGLKQSKMWQAGTLCITIAANIAKTAILTFDACFPDSVVGFKANDKTNNIFIHYWFSFFQAILESQAPESAQKNINLKVLSELKIIVPPIEKQNGFADFVEQVDKSKFVVQKAHDEAQLLFNSLMQEYFG
ncbi:MAG: restriction endonuclease subunit S [Clostridia bacterium]|nr:restriction endonuclease subunit S [Clostridia bacterium]